MLKLIGVPYDANSSFLRGPALAPNAIRFMDTQGAANRFCERGLEIVEGVNYTDLGDMDLKDLSPEKAYNAIKSRIEIELSAGQPILSLGGDHSVSFPIIEAHAQVYPGLHVLHLDAHTDLYDDFEGNPYSHASPFARLMETRLVQSLTQVGIRTYTTHQREQAQRFNVKVIEMKDFNLEFLNSLQGPLYISLDIDVLDPSYAPGISHHEPGGMTTRELISVLHGVQVNIVGADLVELNPKRDSNHITAMVAYKLFKELVSKMVQP